ncbi:NAD-P-binding protein [Pilatotrama ljubarskyi]|nr:NAD-P-binding protein [Pilatotrama ljubarskyi]
MPASRVWFITGTSAGFGRALTELILEKGESVVATARRPSTLQDLTDKFGEDRLLTVKLDVTIAEEVTAAFAGAKAAFGRIDVVVNNAGYGHLGEVESMDDETARAMFETNFWGAVKVTREAIKFFRDSNPPGLGGRLLQMSSILGMVGIAAHTFYAASKHALEGMTESLAQELDPAWNIKITLVEPGWFRTAAVGKIIWSTRHPAYTNPDLPANRFRAQWDGFASPGDTRKAVEVFYKIAALPEPPLRFPVGKDALRLIRRKLSTLEASMDQYESWSEDLLVDDADGEHYAL